MAYFPVGGVLRRDRTNANQGEGVESATRFPSAPVHHVEAREREGEREEEEEDS